MTPESFLKEQLHRGLPEPVDAEMLRRENEDLQRRNRELEAKVAELTAAVSPAHILAWTSSVWYTDVVGVYLFFLSHSWQNMKKSDRYNSYVLIRMLLVYSGVCSVLFFRGMPHDCAQALTTFHIVFSCTATVVMAIAHALYGGASGARPGAR